MEALMPNKTYEYSKTQRMQLVTEMLETAKGRAKEEQALNSYIAWHEAEESYPEPDVSGLVSWTMECAIVSDLAHIYMAKRPEGVFGSQYEREYIKLKQKNAKVAARKKAQREASRASRKGEMSGEDLLRSMLII